MSSRLLVLVATCFPLTLGCGKSEPVYELGFKGGKTTFHSEEEIRSTPRVVVLRNVPGGPVSVQIETSPGEHVATGTSATGGKSYPWEVRYKVFPLHEGGMVPVINVLSATWDGNEISDTASRSRTHVDPVDLFLLVLGALSICAAAFDWNWLFETRKARFVVVILGRTAARIFYGLIGIACVAFGIIGLVGQWF